MAQFFKSWIVKTHIPHDIICLKQDVKMMKFQNSMIIFEKCQPDTDAMRYPNTSVRILIMWR